MSRIKMKIFMIRLICFFTYLIFISINSIAANDIGEEIIGYLSDHNALVCFDKETTKVTTKVTTWNCLAGGALNGFPKNSTDKKVMDLTGGGKGKGNAWRETNKNIEIRIGWVKKHIVEIMNKNSKQKSILFLQEIDDKNTKKFRDKKHSFSTISELEVEMEEKKYNIISEEMGNEKFYLAMLYETDFYNKNPTKITLEVLDSLELSTTKDEQKITQGVKGEQDITTDNDKKQKGRYLAIELEEKKNDCKATLAINVHLSYQSSVKSITETIIAIINDNKEKYNTIIVAGDFNQDMSDGVLQLENKGCKVSINKNGTLQSGERIDLDDRQTTDAVIIWENPNIDL